MKLDIAQLNYFNAIVDANLNLTLAAQNIHVTQSALSQFINNFEKEENLLLFHRKNGRLTGLTPSGEKMYQQALEIVGKHEELHEMLEQEAQIQQGTIRLGISTIILRLFFTKFIPKFMMNNPGIKIEVIEANNDELATMLNENRIHASVLVDSTKLQKDKFEQHIMAMTEITAFMHPNHPLAKEEKLNWKMLDNQYVATFNKGFATHTMVMDKLKKIKSHAKVLITSDSWDYMVEATTRTNLIALLPTAEFKKYYNYLDNIGVVEKRFNDPIDYIPVMCFPVKKKYSNIEKYVYDSFIREFPDAKRGDDNGYY